MLHTFLVVIVNMVKIGVHLRKLSQKINTVLSLFGPLCFLPHDQFHCQVVRHPVNFAFNHLKRQVI